MYLAICEIKKKGEEATLIYFNVLSQLSPGGAEENHERL
jgi:hypothetical protein